MKILVLKGIDFNITVKRGVDGYFAALAYLAGMCNG